MVSTLAAIGILVAIGYMVYVLVLCAVTAVRARRLDVRYELTRVEFSTPRQTLTLPRVG